MQRDFDAIGMGSVVVDYIHPVDAILGPESKGILKGQERLLGGVVLNHLSWAAALGLRTAVFGIGADDEDGAFVRRGLDALGVDHAQYLKSGGRTAVSRIYVDPRGERAIYMDQGANGEARAKDIPRFLPLMRRSRLLSTEISQLRLDTVLKVLKLGEQAGCRTFLDLDLPPSQALTAKLGKAAQMSEALKLAHVLKAAADAAAELVPRQAPLKMAMALHKKLKKRVGDWVALTAGAAGSALTDGREGFFVAGQKGLKVVDTTGAGDAFFGGLMAGAAYGLKLRDACALANAAGAANVIRLGAAAPARGGAALVFKHYAGSPFSPRPQQEARAGTAPAGDGPLAFSRNAVQELASLADKAQAAPFQAAAELIRRMEADGGHLQVTGIGKPEHVARYIASSYSSIGTPCYFLHGTEAVHGSAGQIGQRDVVIAISNSGETAELKATLLLLKERGAKVIGVSGNASSWLARQSDVFLYAGVGREGDALNMAPRASVMAEILVLSALGVALQEAKNFSKQDFQKFHPGGALGKAA